jgi:phage terminase large subunit-like protein
MLTSGDAVFTTLAANANLQVTHSLEGGFLAVGNASMRIQDETEGPWFRWHEKDPAERAIRFIETYCRAPKGAGHGKPIKLAEFQKRWIREILAPGIRQAAFQAPRGQGKSTLLASLAVWALFDRNPTGEPSVPIVATTVAQAKRAVFTVACKMVAAEPKLATRSLLYKGVGDTRLVANAACGGGEMFPIASDIDTLQGLDPSLAIIDEIGFQPIAVWNAVVMASGKRSSSLVVSIGTPGPDSDSALWTLREKHRNGTAPPGVSFTELSAPDDCDYRDEKNWLIANPAITEGYLEIDALRNDVAMMPEAEFRLFRLAQFVQGTDCWLGTDGRKVWRALASDDPLTPGAPTWVGVDIGLKRDTTAVVLGQWHDGRLRTTAKIWQPTEQRAIDITAVMNHIRELSRTYQLVEVAYDPAYFDTEATALADEGLEMVTFPQSSERMVPACGDLYESIMRGEISHDGAHDFERHVLNAMPTYPADKGFRLTKSKSRGHIDACIALALMHSRALHSKPLPKLVCL